MLDVREIEDKINLYIGEIEDFSPESLDEVEQFRNRFLAKKGLLAELFENFKSVPPEKKK